MHFKSLGALSHANACCVKNIDLALNQLNFLSRDDLWALGIFKTYGVSKMHLYSASDKLPLGCSVVIIQLVGCIIFLI